MTTKTQPSRLAEALLKTADDMRRIGIIDIDTHAKITLRHLGKSTVTAEPISGDEIRQVREQAHLSQAVFARCLNVSGRPARRWRCSTLFAARVSRSCCK